MVTAQVHTSTRTISQESAPGRKFSMESVAAPGHFTGGADEESLPSRLESVDRNNVL